MNTNLESVANTEAVSDEAPAVDEVRELSMPEVTAVAGGPVIGNNVP